MNIYNKIIFSIIPFLVIFIGFIVYLENQKNSGKEFTLHVVTRDPGDLLRGDYVNLNYEIDRYTTDMNLENSYSGGEKLCVKLGGDPAKVLAAKWKKDIDRSGDYLCADYFSDPNMYMEKSTTSTRVVTLHFEDISKYFLPAGKGYYIDEEARKGNVDVVVSVTKNGRAFIKYLKVNGKEVDFKEVDRY